MLDSAIEPLDSAVELLDSAVGPLNSAVGALNSAVRYPNRAVHAAGFACLLANKHFDDAVSAISGDEESQRA